MGVLDSSYIKALGVKSAGLKNIFGFSGHPNVNIKPKLSAKHVFTVRE